MHRTGYSGVDLEIPDYLDQLSHEYSIMITTAVKLEEEQNAELSKYRLRFPKTMVIANEDSSVQQILAAGIRDHHFSSGGTECRIMSLEEASKTADLHHCFCFFLQEVDESLLANLTAPAFAMLQQVITKAPGLLWVTDGGGIAQEKPQKHLVDGLSRVARTEFNNLVFATLALESFTPGNDDPIRKITQVIENILAQSEEDFESEYREEDGMLKIGRVLESNSLNEEIRNKTLSHQHKIEEFGDGPPLALHLASPGLLNSLQFLEDFSVDKPLASEEVEIKVEASGVNFRDCLTALGQIDTKLLGCECSGVVSRAAEDSNLKPGDRVAALFSNTYATFARGRAECVTKIPDDMTFAEASSLPLVFFTAWYGLCDIARLQPGESVLIHAGAGGTGQAAIQVAKYVGAEVYVTVGSDDKRRLLMDNYGVSEDHIFYSRNTSFAEGVMRMTGNKGVDVVLNSLSGEALVASWECIAPVSHKGDNGIAVVTKKSLQFGRFIEIGKRDINSRGNLPMWQFDKNASFSAIDVVPLMSQRPSIFRKTFGVLMNLIREKKLHGPRPLQVFGISEIETAFRSFQNGRNSGKMVLEMRKHDKVPVRIHTISIQLFE